VLPGLPIVLTELLWEARARAVGQTIRALRIEVLYGIMQGLVPYPGPLGRLRLGYTLRCMTMASSRGVALQSFSQAVRECRFEGE
jgi:hypothetical protein